MIAREARYVSVLEANSTSWPSERKLDRFGELEPGWDHGEGMVFTGSVLRDARSLIQEATQWAFFDTDAFPGPNGEVMVTVYSGEDYLEFILEPDGSVTVCREKGDKQVHYQEGLSLHDAKSEIRRLRKATTVWNTSESSTGCVMTIGSGDSPAWLSRVRKSLLSASSVSFGREEPSANT